MHQKIVNKILKFIIAFVHLYHNGKHVVEASECHFITASTTCFEHNFLLAFPIVQLL